MGRYVGLAALAAVGLMLSLGCSSDHSHPPYELGNSHLATPPGHVSGKGGGGAGPIVADGGSAVGTGTVVGTVSVFNDASFITSTPFTGTGTITVRGVHDVTVDFTGPDIVVDQVDTQPALWAGIRATTMATDLMPTIVPVDGTASSVSVAFGRTSAVTQILATAVNTPVELESTAAQIVLGFVSATTSVPIAGVQITNSLGQGQAIIYDFDATYSDQQGATEARGMAIFANAGATASSPFPGEKTHITYSFPTTTTAGTTTTNLGVVDVYVYPGALTIALVPIKQ